MLFLPHDEIGVMASNIDRIRGDYYPRSSCSPCLGILSVVITLGPAFGVFSGLRLYIVFSFFGEKASKRGTFDSLSLRMRQKSVHDDVKK